VTTGANLQTDDRPQSFEGDAHLDKINELSLGRKLVLGAGVLLLIDTFLDWRQVDTVLGTFGQSAWHGFFGVLLGLMTVALVAWVALRAFGSVELPEGIPEGLISLVLGALILLFSVIKITESHTHWPAYAGILLAAVVTYGAWLVFQDSGESFPSMPSSSSRGSSSTAAAAPPPVAPPASPADTPPPADAASSDSEPSA
jgi:hypothetical protein